MKINHLNKLASKIAKIEGKKSQAKIGDIREILSVLGEIWVKSAARGRGSIDLKELDAILVSGRKRIKKNLKKG